MDNLDTQTPQSVYFFGGEKRRSGINHAAPYTDSHNREKFNHINPLLLTSTKNNRLTEKQCKYKIIHFWLQAARQV